MAPLRLPPNKVDQVPAVNRLPAGRSKGPRGPRGDFAGLSPASFTRLVTPVVDCATHAGRGSGLFFPLRGVGADPRDALDPNAGAGLRVDDARGLDGADGVHGGAGAGILPGPALRRSA